MLFTFLFKLYSKTILAFSFTTVSTGNFQFLNINHFLMFNFLVFFFSNVW